VTGVVYFDANGAEQRQAARIVCVAGNTIESPRLLLNSASAMFPDGLANSSGQVGRNYMRHVTGSVYAVFDKPVRMWRGTTMAGIVQDEARNDPSRGFVGGFELETLSLGLPFMAAFLDPGAWGREFTTALDGYENMAGMWIVGEDMPQETNRVTLNSEVKDQFGLPAPNGGNAALAGQLGDGVNENDQPFLTTFPYVATPISGFDKRHVRPPTFP
jgi:choline dehydrogenase-like flavoprotein